jgi:hypothetical protein
MNGRSVAKLTFACLLVACLMVVFYSRSQHDGAAQGAAAPGPRGTTTVTVGNCRKTTGDIGGTPVRYCKYSKVLPYCTTDFSNCSDPPQGPCADNNIVDPRPC